VLATLGGIAASVPGQIQDGAVFAMCTANACMGETTGDEGGCVPCASESCAPTLEQQIIDTGILSVSFGLSAYNPSIAAVSLYSGSLLVAAPDSFEQLEGLDPSEAVAGGALVACEIAEGVLNPSTWSEPLSTSCTISAGQELGDAISIYLTQGADALPYDVAFTVAGGIFGFSAEFTQTDNLKTLIVPPNATQTSQEGACALASPGLMDLLNISTLSVWKCEADTSAIQQFASSAVAACSGQGGTGGCLQYLQSVSTDFPTTFTVEMSIFNPTYFDLTIYEISGPIYDSSGTTIGQASIASTVVAAPGVMTYFTATMDIAAFVDGLLADPTAAPRLMQQLLQQPLSATMQLSAQFVGIPVSATVTEEIMISEISFAGCQCLMGPASEGCMSQFGYPLPLS